MNDLGSVIPEIREEADVIRVRTHNSVGLHPKLSNFRPLFIDKILNMTTENAGPAKQITEMCQFNCWNQS